MAQLENLVRQLSRVGVRPNDQLIEQILAHGPAARPALLALATKTPDLFGSMPAALGPIHALRLLGALADLSLLDPLLDLLPLAFDPNDRRHGAARIFAEEVPQIVARIGAPAVPLLWARIDNVELAEQPRGVSALVLSFVTAYAPALRDEIVATARQRLAESDDQVVVTIVISLLANLGDEASYQPMMAAYRTKRARAELFGPAMARQLMLNGGITILSCVNHSVFERYEHHAIQLKPLNSIDDDLDADWDDDWED